MDFCYDLNRPVLQIIFGLRRKLYLNFLNVLLLTIYGSQIQLKLETNVRIKLMDGLMPGL
jgi:hypothetical protein